MKRLIISFGLMLLIPQVATAADHIVICHVGGPGNTEQARDGVAQFLRHLEALGGLEAEALAGEYHTTWKGCKAYIDAHGPVVGVFDLATLLAQSKALRLTPFAHVGDAEVERYHLLVREGTFPDLSSLAGKGLISPYVRDARFLNHIILGAAVGADHFVTKHTKRPLKGIRAVAREKQDATVVDGEAYGHLAKLDLPVTLTSIFTSEGLPGLTMTSMGAGKSALSTTILAALGKLCAGEGKSLCKSLGVTRFTKANPARFDGLLKRY